MGKLEDVLKANTPPVFAEDMTLRDHFAGLAVPGLVAHGWATGAVAMQAYQIADSMMKEREMSRG